MPKHSSMIISRAAWILAAGLGVAAAASKSPSPADSAAIAMPGHEAHMECMADSGDLAKLRQTLQTALKSGDQAKMKSALEAADAHIAKMQAKMEKCKAKMGKAGGDKAGHDDGMMCGRDHEETGAHPGGKPAGDPHAGHH
jgi:hypothetical protein